MTVHFHEEDLPEGVLAPGPGRRRHRDDGAPARPRPALPRPDRRRPRRRASRPLRRRAAPMPRPTSRRCSPIRRGSSSTISPASTSPRSSAYLGVMAAPVYCTKTASRLIRTYTDRHGLKDLVKEVLGQEISKQQQSSDWGAPELSDAQKDYAAVRRALSPRAEGEARRPAGARGPHRARPGLLRLPAAPRRCSISPAGPSRTSSPMSELACPSSRSERIEARLGEPRRQPRPARSASSSSALPALIGVVLAFLFFSPLEDKQEVSFLLDKNKVEKAPGAAARRRRPISRPGQ